MIGFLRSAPSIARLPADQIDPEYRRLRRQVFAGIFLGYAAYYLVRNNLALAIPDILKEYPAVLEGRARHGADRAVDRLRRVEVPDGLDLGPEQPAVFPAARAAAVGGDHCGDRTVQGHLRVARAPGGAADPERLGAGHGLAALRQDDGALVQHQGARRGGVGVEHRAQRRRRRSSPASPALGVFLFADWGAKFYFNAMVAAVRSGAGASSCCATRRSRAGCRRSRSTATTTRRTTARRTSATSRSGRSSSNTS